MTPSCPTRRSSDLTAVQMQRDAELTQQIGHGRDVGEMRQIGETQRLVGEQRRRHQRQRRILCAADHDFAVERRAAADPDLVHEARSEEHTSELQSLMRISYAVFCLKKKTST